MKLWHVPHLRSNFGRWDTHGYTTNYLVSYFKQPLPIHSHHLPFTKGSPRAPWSRPSYAQLCPAMPSGSSPAPGYWAASTRPHWHEPIHPAIAGFPAPAGCQGGSWAGNWRPSSKSGILSIYLSIYIYSIPVIEKLEQSWNPGNLRWHTELGIFLRLPDVTTKLLPNKQGLNSKKWG